MQRAVTTASGRAAKWDTALVDGRVAQSGDEKAVKKVVGTVAWRAVWTVAALAAK